MNIRYRWLILLLSVAATFVIFNCSGKGARRQTAPAKEEDPAVVEDVAAPTVSITAPEDGQAISEGELVITAEASDNKEVARVEFYSGDELLGEDADGSDGWGYNTTVGVPYGERILKAVAFDKADNKGESEEVKINVVRITFGVSIKDVELSSAIQASDGSYYSVGAYHGEDGGEEGDLRAFILRLDRYGNILWQRILTGYYGALYAVHEGAAGEIVASGIFIESEAEPDLKFALLRFNSEGTLTGQKIYSGINLGFIPYAVAAGDGGYIIYNGTVAGMPAGSRSYIIRVNPDGGVVWGKVLPTNYSIYSVQPVEGGFVAVGQIEGMVGRSSYAHGLLIRMDNDGNIIWQRSFRHEPSQLLLASVKPLSDGNYIVNGIKMLGTTSLDTIILKVDAGGDIIWQKLYSGLMVWPYSGGIEVMEDGSMLINAAILGPGPYDSRAYLMKIDDRGSIIWGRAYDRGVFSSLRRAGDGGLLVAGQVDTESMIIKGNEEVLIGVACLEGQDSSASVNVFNTNLRAGTPEGEFTDITSEIVVRDGEMGTVVMNLATGPICVVPAE